MTTAADNSLKWVLRVVGGVELFAIPFVLLPFSWLANIHSRIPGLGTLPESPVVEYLARSLSALYAIHGAMSVRMSFDIARFRPLIRFLGWLHIAFGIAILGIGLTAGLPWYWVAMEGPGLAVGGLLILMICQSTNAAQVP